MSRLPPSHGIKVESDQSAAVADKGAVAEHDTFQWRIPLAKWRSENREREYSSDFKLDGKNWRVLLFPNGNPNHSVAGCMAAYLELKPELAYYSTVCQFKMQMVHPVEPNKYAWREATHTFSNTEADRGFNDLLTPATVADYTYDGGSVVVSISARKAPPGVQMQSAMLERFVGAGLVDREEKEFVGRRLTSSERTNLAALDEANRLAIQDLLDEDRQANANRVAAIPRCVRSPLPRAPSESDEEDEEEEKEEEEGEEEEEEPAAAQPLADDEKQPDKESSEAEVGVGADAGAAAISDVDQLEPLLSASSLAAGGSAAGGVACSICFSHPPSALTLCCSMLRVCDPCMRRLLTMQSSGQLPSKCPVCNCAEVKGKKFGKKQIVFGVKM